MTKIAQQRELERARYAMNGRFSHNLEMPCWNCRHPDGRDETHQRGCPKLPPVSQERMLAIALACERGWRRRAKP